MATPTITRIEEAILAAVTTLGFFATVESCGRKELPPAYAYPAAFVYFDGDAETPEYAEYADKQTYVVVVQTTNLVNEAAAALDAYAIIDLVRDAIRGTTLGFADIAPLRCISRQLTDYVEAEGMIEYTLKFETVWYR